MKQPHISERAAADLDEIWLCIAQDNGEAADRLVARIHDHCCMLADSPGFGRPRSELGAELRSSTVGTYVVFYRPIADGITVVRVLSGYRDLPEQFDE